MYTDDKANPNPNAGGELALPLVTGADAVVLSLLAEGVDLIFGYPGGAIMPVYDALYGHRDRLHHVLVRHEQGAIHAAQGYARATKRPGVCIATSGPGATNLVTGIADAYIDSTPVVCITGQVASHLLGTDAFQETDVINVTAPVSKWNVQVTRAEDIPKAIAKAFYIARSGRPGPVLLDITKDAQFEKVQFRYEKCTSLRSYVPRPVAPESSIRAAADLINNAKKPLIIAGQGVVLSGAERELLAFAEKTGAPVAWTLLGLDAFPTSHPQSVGMVGMHGRYGANVKTNECDVLIGVGMRFDDRVTGNPKSYATQAKVIHIEIDPAEINKIIPAAVPVLGDARDTLLRLTPIVAKREHPEWMQEFRACDAIEHEKVISRDLDPNDEKLRMGEVVRLIAELTGGEAVIVSDVGQHQMAAARYSRFEIPRTSITSGGLGTMGFALPAAMGAKLADTSRTVVAIIGDGGFQMNMQELGTIMQTACGVKIVILNNNFLGMVRQWQELFFERRYSQTDMQNPDFVKLASAFDIPGQRVDTRPELEQALRAMLDCPGPYLLDVRVEREGNVFPMVPTGASISDIKLEP
jgi:acetolactate synthase-1/2/3 large subunit